jgi:acyl-CoA thioester hydrolase
LSAEFSINIRVYYEDTDLGGVVYYANYLKFMERARTDYLRQAGIDQAQLLRDARRMFVVTQASIDYLVPAGLDDWLTVTAKVERVRRASLLFSQECWRSDQSAAGQAGSDSCERGELLTTGTVMVACLDADSRKPCAIPQNLKMVLDR